MKIYRPMPIDYTLKALERRADAWGIQLEDIEGYVDLCAYLTDIDCGEQPSKWFSKEDCMNVLKTIIKEVAPAWVGKEYEFHLNCQPVERKEVQ